MERRRFLGWLATVSAGGLAGCSDTPAEGSQDSSTLVPVDTETPSTPGLAAGDVELPVPKQRLELAGFRDSIPAITEPAYAEDWSEVRIRLQRQALSSEFDFEFEPRLTAETPVIGVERRGTARAYPLGVLNWFEVVNDVFPAENGANVPVLVTYCPLCRTGLSARRTVQGEPTTFGVSGLLYRDNLVMYDEQTSSLWSQIRAQAIRGPMSGTRLSLLPSSLTRWDEWRDTHPDTRVLLPPPISKTVAGEVARDVTRSPYGNYENVTRVGVGPGQLKDDRLHPKAIVIGIRSDGEVRAYPLKAVREAGGLVNDVVGTKPVVVAATEDSLEAYDRRIGGRARTFERAGPEHMRAADSRWRIATGRAVDGPFQGEELTAASSSSALYWFAWTQFNPETDIWSPEA
jgi:hypothetical protein